MLFKETQPILPAIWKKNKKTDTLGRMLKKRHKILKAFTMAQLFGWIWEGGQVQVLKKSTLKSDQGKNKTQDLNLTSIHKEEGRIG